MTTIILLTTIITRILLVLFTVLFLVLVAFIDAAPTEDVTRHRTSGRREDSETHDQSRLPDGGTKAISSARIKQPKRHAGATSDP